ncbi:MAG: nitroreductase family protein [Clostridiales Family XIII bacterium]|jgi:nitroreductase|nr:nitroreductase family protein [Clostridiales Family XIII bacterium]
MQNILNRRSVRSYTEAPIPDEVLVQLLKAGLCAPSAKNLAPWEFVAVRERAQLDALAQVSPYWKALEKATLAIAVLANTTDYDLPAIFYVQDCSAATQNILIAAESLGLGAVWLGLYGREERMEAVQQILGIPDHVVPVTMIALGHPAKHPSPHTAEHPEKLHFESYGTHR